MDDPAVDQQAMEMVTYDMGRWMEWDRKHHGLLPYLVPHTTPIEDCPICRWGCDVWDCDCAAATQGAEHERSN